MLSTERDFERGGVHFAVPSQGEIEGKLLVYEVVAIACIRELIGVTGEIAIRPLRAKVVKVLQQRLADLKLAPDDAKAAEEYSLQLLDEALDQVSQSSPSNY